MIIITGPGRSGTSMLARFCKKLGYDPGGHWVGKWEAGMEDHGVVLANNKLDTPHFTYLVRKIKKQVIKDPRFVVNPGVAKGWLEARQDLAFVVLLRDYKPMIASRRQQFHDNEKYWPQFTKTKIARHVADFMLDVSQYDVPVRVLRFPQLLWQFDRVYRTLTELGLKMPRVKAEKIWQGLINPDLVHYGTEEVLPPSAD